jgi:hypothetical protein
MSLDSLASTGANDAFRRAVSKALHVKQFAETEGDLTRALSRFFRSQIKDVGRRLDDIDGSNARRFGWYQSWAKTPQQAEVLRELIYDPKEWREELINATFPALTKGMIEAVRSQLIIVGISPDKSTASEWVDDEGIDLAEVEGIGIATEMPSWMRDAIEIQLRETFEQDYWQNILTTTGSDIEGFLRDGLQEGLSIKDLARIINRAFPTAYSMGRATLIARTESGNALNGARALAVDKLREELGDAGATIRKSWLSVLGNTTRDSHAALDGVPADEEGMWNLDGVRIPWPSHFSLPAKNRVNCQCTITTEFGLTDEDAARLIQLSQPLPEPKFENVSKEFQEQITNTLSEIPRSIRARIEIENEATVSSGKFVRDVRPDLIGVTPRGWSHGDTWDMADGFYDRTDKDIVVTEFRATEIKDKEIISSQRSKRVPQVLMHEYGHAVDDALEKVSTRSDFVKEWKKDIGDLFEKTGSEFTEGGYSLKGDAGLLSYYIQPAKQGLRFGPSSAGASEVFAEGFSVVHGQGFDRIEFERSFPRTIAKIKSILQET